MVWKPTVCGDHSIDDLLFCYSKGRQRASKQRQRQPLRDPGPGLASSVGFTLLGSGCSVLCLAVVHREFGESSESPGRWMSSSSRFSWSLEASGGVCVTRGGYSANEGSTPASLYSLFHGW